MKAFVIIIILLPFLSVSTCAQKVPLQLDSYKNWPEVSNFRISNNGRFACYNIDNEPVGANTWIIRSIENGWESRFINLSDVNFSNDNRYFYGKLSNDTLLCIHLYNHLVKKIPQVSTYQLFIKDGIQWLATQSTEKVLTFRNLTTQHFFSLQHVTSYILHSNGIAALIQQEIKEKEMLQWLDLNSGKTSCIFEGMGVNSPVFDNAGTQAAFMRNAGTKNEIWYYTNSAEKAIKLVDSSGIEKGNYWGFNWDDKQLFFSLQTKQFSGKISNPNLTVWNYQDTFLQSDLQISQQFPATNLYSILIADRKIIPLMNNQQLAVHQFNPKKDKYLLLQTLSARADEMKWNPKAAVSYILCDIKTGEQRIFKTSMEQPINNVTLSPENKYVVYFDAEHAQYCSYSIANGKTIPIVRDSSGNLMRLNNYQDFTDMPGGICGWLPEDKGVLINGNYDIIQVDPEGIKQPVQFTQQQGAKNETVFNICEGDVVGSEGNIILSAFNVHTKQLGFYNFKIGDKLKFDDIHFISSYFPDLHFIYSAITNRNFIKAKNNSIYLLKLEQSDRSPNIMYTKDFKHYVQLSKVNPEKSFNWMTAELHTYSDSVGNLYEGILYKPENFDSSKSYPVIFNYYITKSNELNRFLPPTNYAGDINTSYLVSNGYLVFEANIRSEKGKTGEGALRSVNAAADHLGKFKWVNSRKMAISGHSFGGFETDYIVTHTNRFAAAVSAAGISDLIAFATDIWNINGLSTLPYVMFGVFKTAQTLSESPDIYIQNSPILYARNVSTPLLLMHNPGDLNVPYSQSRSFFIQLRSLKKKVWMLSYNEETHLIGDPVNHMDYYKHLKEFLDHYLMDGLLPEWMFRYQETH
jgi:hypothetical protein